MAGQPLSCVRLKVATVGFGLGDVTLANFLETHHLLPQPYTETDVFVAVLGDSVKAAQRPIAEMRQMGLNVAVGAYGRKLGDQLKTADKKGIAYVVVIGSQELESEQFTIKNLQTGVEEKHSLPRIVGLVKDHRTRP